MALLPVSTPFTMWFCWALPLCVEHTPLPHDVGFRHGFVLASRMRRKWRCSSSKPHLQQVWVPPLVLGLLPSPWKEWAQDHFWFWKRCVVIGTGLFANSTCVRHPGQPQMWGWSLPSPAWVNWLPCNPQVTQGSVRWKDVYLSHWGLGYFCYTAHLAIAV